MDVQRHTVNLRRGSVALAVLLALCLLPPVGTRLNAAAVMADALDLPVKRPFAAQIRTSEVRLGGVEGDLYEPDKPAPPVLVVPGAAVQGRKDPRVKRVAAALARSRRVVFVPELALYDRRFVESDIENIVEAALALSAAADASGKVALVGFSYGGTFGLLAAADSRLDGKISQIATFGAYVDLLAVIQALTTGVSTVGGKKVAWRPDPSAEAIMQANAVMLAPQHQRQALEAALVTRSGRERLAGDARVLYDLVTNRDPQATGRIARRLSAGVKARFDRFSPSKVASQIEAPINALHALDDPLVPYGEALRLKQTFPDSRLLTVKLFRHVDFSPSSAKDVAGVAADLVRVWRFTSKVLRAG